MLTRTQSAIFLTEFLDYFGEHVIAADYDQSGRLIIFTNPYLNYDRLIVFICENIFDVFSYRAHLELVAYPFGSNEPTVISIN